MAGIYCADIYCDDCSDSIRDRICEELLVGRNDSGMEEFSGLWEDLEDLDIVDLSIEDIRECLDSLDSHAYDSDQYPKHCGDTEESDCPQHCGSGADCINAEEITPTDCYGYFFGNDLTTDGEDYVREAVNDDLFAGNNDSPAVLLWMPYYDYINYFRKCEDCGEYADCADNDVCEPCWTRDSEPAEEDYIVTPGGPLGGKLAVIVVGGKFIGLFGEDDDAYNAIRADMEASQFWPNVWFISDHGNASIIDIGLKNAP